MPRNPSDGDPALQAAASIRDEQIGRETAIERLHRDRRDNTAVRAPFFIVNYASPSTPRSS